MDKFSQVRTSVENLNYQLADKELEREDLDRFELENGYEVGDGYTKEVMLINVFEPLYIFKWNSHAWRRGNEKGSVVKRLVKFWSPKG